ncbi:MAG: 4-hydroxy-tetrahydrodipicolinate reductase [Bdellovibrionales bacterium]|nr:4-hydroxy-tetrahydrodipicolinate reductase [Bdellovibrionales bacterium]
MRVAVVGASGRTGSHVVSCVLDNPDHTLSAAVIDPNSSLVGTPVPGMKSPINYTFDIAHAISVSDAIIDFSMPPVTQALVEFLSGHPIPVVIGTTGHSAEQRLKIENLGKLSPVLLSSNTSLGVYALLKLTGEASRLLKSDFEVEVVEAHHRGKIDAPSGTAKSIVESLDRGQKVPTHSIRAGDVVGTHHVYFYGDGEQIEITHRATSRRLFGIGALRLVEGLAKLSPGFYTPKDVYEIA